MKIQIPHEEIWKLIKEVEAVMSSKDLEEDPLVSGFITKIIKHTVKLRSNLAFLEQHMVGLQSEKWRTITNNLGISSSFLFGMDSPGSKICYTNVESHSDFDANVELSFSALQQRLFRIMPLEWDAETRIVWRHNQNHRHRAASTQEKEVQYLSLAEVKKSIIEERDESLWEQLVKNENERLAIDRWHAKLDKEI